MSNMNEIIIIGGNHHNTLGVIRALGEKGLSATLIVVSKDKKPFVSCSKYLKRVIQIASDDQIPITLLSACKSDNGQPVVICCTDASAGVVDENMDSLAPFFLLPGADTQGRISSLMSKKSMASLAVEVGLSIPQTCYADVLDNPDAIPLPCIIKPLVSRMGTKAHIKTCHSTEEARQWILHVGANQVQIQQFIDKDFEYQLIGCSTDNDVIIPGVSKILRPCKGSNTSFLHYEPLSKDFCDLQKCKDFVRKTGYKGLFSLEFLRDKHGNDYFMEINFRNDGNAICVTAAGMNLPYIWCLFRMGKNYQEEASRQIAPVYVMPDLAELKLLLTGQISPAAYLGDLRKTNRFMEYDKNDTRPFWRMIRAKLKLSW